MRCATLRVYLGHVPLSVITGTKYKHNTGPGIALMHEYAYMYEHWQ